MKQRGVSPIISWVLLIGFTIAMGAFITTWAIEQAKNVPLEPDEQSHCDEVRIKVDNVCYDINTQKIKSNLTNQGYFEIVVATFGREAANLSESWCVELNLNTVTIGTGPNQKFYYEQFVNGIFLFNQTAQNVTGLGQLTECNTLNGGDVGPVTKFSMIPWIKIEDKFIPCQDRKIEIAPVPLC